MLQMRPSSGGRAYSPTRDLAWNFPVLVKHALHQMGETDWEAWFGDYLRHTNTTEEDLGKVAKAMALAFNYMLETDIKTPGEALQKAGFFDTPAPAQMAVCSKIAQVMVGAYFAGVRDALSQNDNAPPEVTALVAAGEEVARAFSKPGGK